VGEGTSGTGDPSRDEAFHWFVDGAEVGTGRVLPVALDGPPCVGLVAHDVLLQVVDPGGAVAEDRITVQVGRECIP
jgi:hypothetical protein